MGFKNPSKEMGGEHINFQGKRRMCWKRKNDTVIASRSVLLSLTLMGIVKQPLKGFFLLGFVTEQSEGISPVSSDRSPWGALPVPDADSSTLGPPSVANAREGNFEVAVSISRDKYVWK